MRTLKMSVVIIGLALCACSCGNTGTDSSSSGSSSGTVDAGSSSNVASSGQPASSSASASSSSSTGGDSSGNGTSIDASSSATSTSGGTSNTGSSSSSSGNPNMGTLGVYVDIAHPAVLLNGQMYVADMVGNTVQVPAGMYQEIEVRPPEMVLDGPSGMNMPRLSLFQKNVTISAGQMTRFKDAQENTPVRFDHNICGGWVPAGGGTSFVITGQRITDAPCNDRGIYWNFAGISSAPLLKLQNYVLNSEGCDGTIFAGGGGVSPDGLKISFVFDNQRSTGYMEPARFIKQSHGPCQQ